MAEMPRVFQNTTPCIYTPNCKGYTLQAEAWVPGITASATEEDEKKWKLLVVTSNKERPPVMKEWNTEEGKEIEEVFNRQEIMDYCLPNREDIIFRYSMSPSEQCQVSIQATVSKHDALLKLEILDHEDVVAAVEGRGTCTIPLCSLQHSPLPGTLVKEVSQGEKMNSHKYLVQGSILTKSWPTADTAWPQLSSIRSTDRTEESTTLGIKPGSGKRKKIKMSSISTAVMTIDTRKPHWVLQIVSKDSEGHIAVKKDTEKMDKLKSMVEAWEMQDPGRTQKAQLSRQKFLEAHIIHEEGKDEEDIRSVIGVFAQKLKPNTGPIKIRQMDLSPFILKAEDDQPPKLLDEAERAHRQEERRRMFKEYRVTRKAMLQVRNRDRELRNVAKLKQLETAEKWQVELDFRRLKLNYMQESPLENHQAMEKAKTEKEAELAVANVAAEVQSPLGGRESKVKGVKKKK